MSTFLELCQDVARESRTLSGTVPSTVTDQVGRLLKIVEWTAQAFVDVQNVHAGWRWMQKTYSGDTTASTAKYLPASFGLSDHRDWLRDGMAYGYRPHTIYLTATGVSDETELNEISWHQYRTKYDRRAQTNNRPSEYAISPAGEFCLGAIPDDTYTLQGEYAQAAVRMTADANIPGLPVAHHAIIVWRAIMILAESDGDQEQRSAAALRYTGMLADLSHDQLPRITLGGFPLA